MPRRFPAPWRAERCGGGYVIRDAKGLELAYVYGEDKARTNTDTKLYLDEARRIAAGIARLPGLLGVKENS